MKYAMTHLPLEHFLQCFQLSGNRPSKGLLHLASFLGQSEIVSTSLNCGAQVDERDPTEATPLHYAAWNNEDADVVKILLMAQADPNSAYEEGRTVLHHATFKNSSLEMISTLLAAGADVKATCRNGTTALFSICIGAGAMQKLVEAGADVKVVDRDGGTELHAVVWSGDPDASKILIDAGADPNAMNERRMTPLHWATATSDNS